MNTITIRHYIDDEGRDHFAEWSAKIRDAKAIQAIDRRINRMKEGNAGDCKLLRNGVWELRIDVGAGYRVYYAGAGSTIILLLCGGDKRTQQADIGRACEYWKNFQRKKRKKEAK